MDSNLDDSQSQQGDSDDDDNEQRTANVDSVVLSGGESRKIPRTALSDDTNATPSPSSKRKKKDGNDSSSKSIPMCRFCKKKFTSNQALGGHMNTHREEKSKEKYQKAQNLVHAHLQKLASEYRSGSAPSYYQPVGNSGNHYQGGGIQMANAPVMGIMDGGRFQRQEYQNSNQQYVAAPQMNPNYGNLQQTAQANYQPQPQHGGSYVNYNESGHAARPPHIPGQYQAQETGSSGDVLPYAMPYGGSSTGVAQRQSNIGFPGHDLSQAGGGANMPAVDVMGTLLTGKIVNAATAQFFDPFEFGNRVVEGLSSEYLTDLHQLNPLESHQGPPQDHYTSQASYAGTGVHGTTQVQSDQYNTPVAMENQYHSAGAGTWSSDDAYLADQYINEVPYPSTIPAPESGHGGGDGGASTGRSAHGGSHL